METMKLFGGEFEQYVPYIINEELLASLELYAVKDDDNSARVKIVARDIISNIPKNIIPSIVEDGTFGATIFYGEHKLKIDTLKCLPSYRMFSTFLDLLKEVGSSRKALSCVWYYYPDDCHIKDDASSGEFYHFFIVHGEDIVVPHVSILSSAYPGKMLLKDDDEFVSGDRLTKMALASIFYNKWMSETMAGKVFKEKFKLQNNLHSRQQTTTTSAEESTIHNDAFSVSTEALRKEISTIKWLAFIIVVLLFYDVFIKHQ